MKADGKSLSDYLLYRGTYFGENEMQRRKIRYMVLAVMLLMLMFPTVSRAATGFGSSETVQISGKEKTVILETSGGIVKKKVPVNGMVTLPPDKNGKGYTFMGWSTRQGQTSNPQYQAYEQIKVTRNIRLYPVKYKWSKEENLSVGKLAGQVTNYSRIIFVGDSRTLMLKNTLERQYGSSVYDKVGFVYRSGKGLEWMKESGEARLMNELKTKETEVSRPTAIVFNFGVNDLIHRKGKTMDYRSVASEYASYMNQLSQKLAGKNCRLFYMSVNPSNTAMKPTRKESEIRGFNAQLQKKLNSSFTWLDSYSYLMKYGYSTYRELDGGKDDGLHYSMKTYKRIYAYVLKKLQKI